MKVVIIGNGIAGITAARHIRKRSDFSITVISSESKYFFSRTALMYVYMGHLKFEHTQPYESSFWKKNRIDLVEDHVDRIEADSKTVLMRSGQKLNYDRLIIATGSRYNTFGWPGQNLKGVQGLYHYADLQLMEENTKGIKDAVIVGGGLIGVEMAEMLLSRNIRVTFLVRESEFWNNVLPVQEARLISEHIRSHHVDLKLATELKEITSGSDGRVSSVKTTSGETISCQFVGLTVGVSPNVDWVRDSSIQVNRGILVNEYLETSAPDVFAIGDCAERNYDLPGRKRIEQVWYTGRMMGEVVAQTICSEKTRYAPGPWFNSAKFFDIEYQTYGHVSPELSVEEDDFYWEHPDRKKAVHVVWNKNTGVFHGINTLGIRMRHECFDQWLRAGASIDTVMGELHTANFDPEFFIRHETEILNRYKMKTQRLAAVI